MLELTLGRPLRVVLALAKPIERHGLHQALDETDDIEVVAEVGDAQVVDVIVAACQPHVVVWDCQLGVSLDDSLTVIERLRRWVAVLAFSGAALAQVNDGVLTPADGYGAPIWQQSIQTGFGPAPNGSELAAIYCKSDTNGVTLFFAGALEQNFNKFNVFFDTKAGGQNQIGGTNPSNDGWAAKYNGFTFDTGFNADYMMIFRRGGTQFDIDYAEIGTANGSMIGSIGNGTPSNFSFGAGFNMGYTGSTSTIGGAAGSAVTPGQPLLSLGGIEVFVPYAALGLSQGQTFLLSAMINGSNHDYLSNQFAGSLPVGTGNLGGDGFGGFNGTVGQINLNNWAGDQYITVPAPGVLALVGMGGLLAARRRRA